MWSVLISSTISAVAPLLMALIHPHWPYWYDAFFAQVSDASHLSYIEDTVHRYKRLIIPSTRL